MAADDQTAPNGAGLLVRNETARKVIIEGDGVEIIVPPFDQVELAEDRLQLVDEDALRRSSHLAVRDAPRPDANESASDAPYALLGFLILLAPIWAIVGAFVGSAGYWLIGLAVIVAVTVGVLVAVKLTDKNRKDPGSIGSALARGKGWTTQQMYLATSVAIGVLVPAAVIVFSAELLDVLDEMQSAKPGTDLHPHYLTLVGRGLQLVFIAVASLLPALLFFLFDREQLATQRDRFMRHIARFDATAATRSEIQAKYGRAMDEAYGTERKGAGRLQPGRRSPVLVATVVLTLGWILTLAHTDTGLVRNEDDLLALLDPPREAVVYAFLGAYVYALGTVLRGYVRKDLRPKSYTHITVRTILVIVLAWVLQLQWSGDVLLALVFVAGLVPETAIVLIRESLRPVTKLPFLEEEPDPLTKLEGIDLYDRARLLDEGVTCVEGLAHHDVVELMLQTRIHSSQLVDWVDQAILYLHAGPQAGARAGADRKSTLCILRAYGIRTATDLVMAVDEAGKRPGEELDGLLPATPGSADGVPSRIRVISDVIRDEEWMPNLRRWHSDAAIAPAAHHIDAKHRARVSTQPQPARAAIGA